MKSLLALLLLVPAPSVGVLLAMRIAPGPVGQAVYGLSKLWLLALPLLWLRLVEKSPVSFSPPRRGGFFFGIASGLLMGGAVVLAYLGLGGLVIEPETFRAEAVKNGIGTPGRFAALAAYLILVNSLLEEYVWRWFVFRRCEDLLPSGAAVAASAAFFTLHHTIALAIQFEWLVAALASAGIFAGAAVWSYTYGRYRSIWPGYSSHVIVDVAVLVIGWRLLFA
ncbi:MAG: CPBP family intramembrane metalloprotease [Planctomycetes bacterium]|nr:CPBP family intramembrane metalloprotease [Planctomycetota bacterium]